MKNFRLHIIKSNGGKKHMKTETFERNRSSRRRRLQKLTAGNTRSDQRKRIRERVKRGGLAAKIRGSTLRPSKAPSPTMVGWLIMRTVSCLFHPFPVCPVCLAHPTLCVHVSTSSIIYFGEMLAYQALTA